MKIFNIKKGLVGSGTFVWHINKYKHLSKKQKEKLEFKLKVVDHSRKFGIDSSVNAFEISKRSVNSWRTALKKGRGNPLVLLDKSTRPKSFRQSEVTGQTVLFIKNLKVQFPKLGKDKVAWFLKEKTGAVLSPTQCQNIVNDLKSKGFLKKKVRYYLNGKIGKLIEIKRKKKIFKERRDGFQPTTIGELIQADTIVIVNDTKRFYILTAIDIYNRLAFAKFVPNHGSEQAEIFLKGIPEYFKYDLQRVQTDNGSEFEYFFDLACKTLNIKHLWNYPRSPKSNAYIERFNRTLQDEFLNEIKHQITFDKLKELNDHLKTYLHFYNHERPHWGLNLNTPVRYTMEKCNMCCG